MIAEAKADRERAKEAAQNVPEVRKLAEEQEAKRRQIEEVRRRMPASVTQR